MTGATLPLLDQPPAGKLTIQYAPTDSQVLTENPPRFTWIPVIENEARYLLRISQCDQFSPQQTETVTHLKWNFHTLDHALTPGVYYWSYTVCDPDSGAPAAHWSDTRSFRVTDDLPQTPLPSRQQRFSAVDTQHPRLWLSQSRLSAFKKSVADNPDYCLWSTFYEGSVRPWMTREIMAEPAGYPNHQRVAHIWRQTYIDCQELLYAIRHLAIGGMVTDDSDMITQAKLWLLAAASWDTEGTTSRAYTDEWAFRVNLALAWGYDWLYDSLDATEREHVKDALIARTRQTAHHIMHHANIHLFPYDSHAVRAVSAVLIPSSIALLKETEEAEEWLHYGIEFLSTVYSPWGDAEGGWAEGPHYWMTGIAYLIDAANLIRNFCGIDLYDRPFFHATGDFPLYTKAPTTRRATFGDDATMGALPAVKLGYNLRQLGGVTGNGAYQWYYDEIRRCNPGTEQEFYNWGWWDFNFDELTYRSDFPAIEATDPEDGMRWFKGIGWVAIQRAMSNPDEHLQFVMKSSPFGSISHSHGDQNAFCLAAHGEDLAIQSGHYVAFNSSMHREWRRQTRSKNAILINGKGQYADRDKARAMKSSGRIVEATEQADHTYIKGDATLAYQQLSPEVSSVVREIYFVNNLYFVIVDSVDAEHAVTLEWLLHTNNPMTLGEHTFRYTGQQAGFYGQILWSEAGAPALSQQTGYPDVAPEDYAGLPVSSCFTASFPAATRHRVATLLVPYAMSKPQRVFTFLDDQGYDCDLYFTDQEERSFKITIQKLAKAS